MKDKRWSKKSLAIYERGFNDAKKEDLAIVQSSLMEGSRKILFEIIDKATMAVYPQGFGK